VAGSCEHGNELLGSIKFIEFLDFLNIFTPNITTTQTVRNCNRILYLILSVCNCSILLLFTTVYMQETLRRYFQQYILRCVKPFCSIEYVMQGRLLHCFFKEKIYGILIDIIISNAVLDF
jgi:hypothetical protein